MNLEVRIHYLPCLLLQTIRSLHLIKEAFSLPLLSASALP